MQSIPYKDFSLAIHKKNWQCKKSNLCQFELTFGCGLHCAICYTDCYNKAKFTRNELNTKEVKIILDKVYALGVLWLCFTGGDPLTRRDFLDIYAYAKDKGFIVTIFTNAYSMTKQIAAYLKNNPPFVIEMTLNAARADLYDSISGVKGSFARVMDGIRMISGAGLPLKIKTQVTSKNLQDLPRIKRFVKSLRLEFKPDVFIHGRLNGDLTPCSLRISAPEVLSLQGKRRLPLGDCQAPRQSGLSRCAIGGGDGIHIDPYGNMFPCICIRKPRVNVLKKDIARAHEQILDWVRKKEFTAGSKCGSCSLGSSCRNCAGKALLETGRLGEKVDWFCELAYLQAQEVKA